MNTPEKLRTYWDEQSRCRIIAAKPAAHPDLWDQFLYGATESYERHRVSKALEYPTIADGSTTAMFFAAVADNGEMLGGVRAQGPFTAIEQSHAHVEFADDVDGRTAVHAMIASRIACGVVELKSAWTAEGTGRGRAVTAMIAETPAYSTAILGARYGLATAAAHVRNAWTRTGAVVAEHIDPVPYPDDRYLTHVFWWDNRTLRETAEPDTWRRMCRNTEILLTGGRSAEVDAVVAS